LKAKVGKKQKEGRSKNLQLGKEEVGMGERPVNSYVGGGGKEIRPNWSNHDLIPKNGTTLKKSYTPGGTC